jgi:putative hydrolase of HD superfamily
MNAKVILDFIQEIGVLKNIPRTGWRFRGIKDAESVADHCYRVSLLSMILADVLKAEDIPLDAEKVMRLALLHEIAEARIGDVPFPALEYIPEVVKADAEQAAVSAMLADFGSLGEQYTLLWEEFEKGTSLEAKLVRAADKLELMIQAFEYEKIGYRSLDKFWENDWNQLGFDAYPQIREIMDVLLERRKEELGRCAKKPKL